MLSSHRATVALLSATQADFADVALPTHYNTSKIAKGFGDAVIHFLVSEHGLSTKIHVSLGAIVGVSYIFMLLFNIHARVWHRTIAPIATLSSLGLMVSLRLHANERMWHCVFTNHAQMSNVYAMYVRPGGMAPVGFASFATNTIATVLATAAIAVGLYAKSIPNYVLHRRAMIIAAGAIFAYVARHWHLQGRDNRCCDLPAVIPPSASSSQSCRTSRGSFPHPTTRGLRFATVPGMSHCGLGSPWLLALQLFTPRECSAKGTLLLPRRHWLPARPPRRTNRAGP